VIVESEVLADEVVTAKGLTIAVRMPDHLVPKMTGPNAG